MTIDILRLGHINQFTDDYDGTLDVHARLFGGRAWSQWAEPDHGARNALVSVAATTLEVFAATTPDLAVGQWLGRRGGGWHSIEWAVPDLDAAVQSAQQAGIRVTDRNGDSYAFLHPKDLFGLCLELTPVVHFDGDPRNDESWSSEAGIGPGPLGLVGPATVTLLVASAVDASKFFCDLTGFQVEAQGVRNDLQADVAHIVFGDHVLEFLSPLTPASPLAAELDTSGQRIRSVGYRVLDLVAARDALASLAVATEYDSSSRIVLSPEVNDGARIELLAQL